MSLAIGLLAYSLVVVVIGPVTLRTATRTDSAPRLGIMVWTTAVISVLASVAMSAVLIGVDVVRTGGQLDRLLVGCFATLRALASGHHGEFLRTIAVILAALTALSLAVVASRVLLTLRNIHVHTRRHSQAALLAARGAPSGPGGTLILDAAERSVYCLRGRPNRIIITRPALDALDDAQLAAVLAHEHAHLSGHHHELLGLFTALAKIMPRVRLFSDGATEVTRLVEMSADDEAARRHGGELVVAALVALTTGAPMPARALGATTTSVTDRVERLLFPTNPLRVRLALGLSLAGVLLGPVIAAALVIARSPLCLTMLG